MHDPASPLDAAVATEGLVKRFGRETALAGLDLSVPPGSVYLLAGTNGAGKSTLLRSLINLEAATSGRVWVLGLDPSRNGAAVRAQVGYVPETTQWGYGWMRVGRMLDHIRRFYPSWDCAYAAHLAHALELREDRHLGKLSKGQTRCVQILAALAHRPQLLLLDELTDGLDPVLRHRVLGLFSEHLADTGCTAILSTHLVSEVEGLVDHVGILRGGTLLFQGSAEQLLGQLHRIQIDAPLGWSPDDRLAACLLHREAGIGRTQSFVLSGDAARTAALVAASGASVRQSTRLTLEEAVLVLLRSEKTL